ncbi:MAG: UDP-N-acetylmuramoyl-L-alanyl-D-glutamate--2,6-diaminopimelate ligase [Bacilli bacterium]|nr:UDP-N-acetylmuramoyl-L-alanyl-D-glutamate--2,6-diaminopimelate ligase [Bacilli bacterium]
MIKTNSKEIKPGDIFIALRGVKYDGHDYVEEAINNGASKVIVEHGSYSVPTIVVEDTKQYLSDFVKEYYGPKIKELKLIGITGTNGKTTSCYLIYQMLNKLKVPCAYIGTNGFYLKDEIRELKNTTPDILSLYQMLNECKEKGIKYVAMEVSSHALEMGRVEGLTYDYAVYTNLTEEHMDFHKNMNNYASSKQKLFKMLKSNGKAVVNIDDKYSGIMKINNYFTYGFGDSDYQISKYRIDDNNTIFTFRHNNTDYLVNSPLLGKHNVYNLLTMIIILHEEGLTFTEIISKVPTLQAPPGRMDTVFYKGNRIIIDYAHTPDAVFNILSAIKEFSKGRIYSIIGCGGNRDKTKRPKMAFYALAMCDKVILTNDNPRFEDPNEIINDMLHNNVKPNYEIITNREAAIKRGIELLTKDDILVILGKGHEDYQIINDDKFYHNDKECVLNICRG